MQQTPHSSSLYTVRPRAPGGGFPALRSGGGGSRPACAQRRESFPPTEPALHSARHAVAGAAGRSREGSGSGTALPRPRPLGSGRPPGRPLQLSRDASGPRLPPLPRGRADGALACSAPNHPPPPHRRPDSVYPPHGLARLPPALYRAAVGGRGTGARLAPEAEGRHSANQAVPRGPKQDSDRCGQQRGGGQGVEHGRVFRFFFPAFPTASFLRLGRLALKNPPFPWAGG